MAEDKIRLPSSEGGLVRYGEGEASKFQIKPEYVVGIVVAMIVLFAYLAAYGGKLLGY